MDDGNSSPSQESGATTRQAYDKTDAQGEPGYPGIPSHVPAAKPRVSKKYFESDVYKMDYTYRGMAIIINNTEFDRRTGMGSRSGSDVDAAKMYELFDLLGFEKIRPYKNLKAREMKNIMIEAGKSDFTDTACFACVILSHGEEGYVFGTDDKVSMDDLVLPLKGDKCTSLATKPKLFFIQACRGTELDHGVEVADAGVEEMEVEVVETRRIPTEADFLMAYSVVPGKYAWRNSVRGSWFIQAICDIFTKNWQKMDVLTMMTRVNKKVAYDHESNSAHEHMHCKKQIPCITSMLTKDLYFVKPDYL